MASHRLQIFQSNLQHGKSSTALLGRNVAQQQSSLALVQEPYVYKNKVRNLCLKNYDLFYKNSQEAPRACILASKNLEAVFVEELSTKDCVAVMLNIKREGIPLKMLAVSVYLPHDSEVHPIPELLKAVDWAEGKSMHILIGSDANSHHTIWGSSDVNNRGEDLLDYIMSSQLCVANKGNKPTFVTSRRQEVIDVTLCSAGLETMIKDWRVTDDVTLSDHMYIRFELDMDKPPDIYYRKPTLTNWSTFFRLLQADQRLAANGRLATTEDIDRQVDILNDTLLEAFHKACPLKKVKEGKSVPWWNRRLQGLRSESRKLFRRAKISHSDSVWCNYREKRNEYNAEIRRSKISAWRSFTESVESVSEMSRCKKILCHDRSGCLGTLQKPGGGYTDSTEEALRLLLEVHFPGNSDTRTARTSQTGTLLTGLEGVPQWQLAKDVVDCRKIRWAIATFKPYKAPGADGIFPALLQKSIGVVAEPLCNIYRASIALGYIPERWRTTKVVFIPKPGKDTYSNPKSFRPICLTSFLMKTLERLIDIYIRNGALCYMPLHDGQHAYRAGRSTLSALHSLTGILERAIDRKKIALSAFFDIEGAFSNVTFDAILRACQAHKVSGGLIRWIGAMLKSLVAQATVKGVTQTITVERGCPQGGVLSPLIWALVVDDLLKQLAGVATHSQFYADDGVIVYEGHCISTLVDLMRDSLSVVDRWCRNNGLGINPSKTEVVIFTNKRLTRTPELSLNGVIIPYSKQVKFLGVIFDSKLNWGNHIEYRIRRAITIYWQCRCAVGKTWGLAPKVMHWLYTAVVRPALTYGAIVWWPRVKLVTCRQRLARVQRLAAVAITGAIRTTPTAALDVMCGLFPLEIYIKKIAMETAYRLQIARQWKRRIHGTKHGEIMRQLTEGVPVSAFPSDLQMGVLRLNKPYTVSFPSRAEWRCIEGILGQRGVICYTDGSLQTSGFSGAAWHCITPPYCHQEVIPTGKWATVFQTEVWAITACARFLYDQKVTNREVFVCSDSQAALRALEASKVSSRLVNQCRVMLTKLAVQNSVKLIWVPGHMGLEGNEKADELAREAAEMVPVGPEPFIPISYASVRSRIADWAMTEHWAVWDKAQCRQAKDFIEGPGTIKKTLLSLERTDIRNVVAMLTGHGPFRLHLSRLGVVDQTMCRFCGEIDETAAHLLCFCPALAGRRLEELGATNFCLNQISQINISNICRFARLLKLSEE